MVEQFKRHDIELRGETFSLCSLAAPPDVPILHWAHATGFNAETYLPLFAPLADRLQIFMGDARGHGMSQARACPSELKNWYGLAEDLLALVERLVDAAGRKIYLGGHSMGGCVSLLAADARPDLVEGLVLVDPVIMPRSYRAMFKLYRVLTRGHGRSDLASAAARRRAIWPSVEEMATAYTGRGAFTHWQPMFLSAYLRGGTRPHRQGVALTCAPAWEAAIFGAQAHDAIGAARRLRRPFLLLCAQHNSTMRAARAFAKAPAHGVIKTLPDSTHFIPMEQPEILRAEIIDWLGLDR